MSEDDSHESGCDTVEGSPAPTSTHGDRPYRYLDDNRPNLAATVAPPPCHAARGRSPPGVRTMVVPPMRMQNNNGHGTAERFQRIGVWNKLIVCMFLYHVTQWLLCVVGFIAG